MEWIHSNTIVRDIIYGNLLGKSLIEISPHFKNNPLQLNEPKYEPFHILYYSETSFKTPHYQSIRPHNKLKILQRKPLVANTLKEMAPSEFMYMPPPIFKSSARYGIKQNIMNNIFWLEKFRLKNHEKL